MTKTGNLLLQNPSEEKLTTNDTQNKQVEQAKTQLHIVAAMATISILHLAFKIPVGFLAPALCLALIAMKYWILKQRESKTSK